MNTTSYKAMKLASEKSPAEHERNFTSPSGVTPDAKVARVSALLHGISLILRHHSAPYEVIKSLRTQLKTFLTVDEEERFLKRAKYVILLPMSRYLKNEEPPPADVPFDFCGRFRRWARQRLNCYSKKNTHLWYSFLQSKRAGLPVTPDIVLSNFQKHRRQMEQPDPLREGCEESEELLNEVLENLAPILGRLRKILNSELLGFFRNPQREIHKGSESASFESSRKTGGQAGQLRLLMGVDGLRERESLFRAVETPGLSKVSRGVMSNTVLTSSARYGELQDLEEILEAEIQDFVDGPIRLDAKVEAVLEPFKVRTISKGESLPYYLAKRMQLSLHGAMRKMDCFRLIGAPLNPADLLGIRKHTDVFMDSESAEWLSIDYSAATDGLSAALSSAIMKELLGNLYFENPGLYNMMLSVLAPHFISYPEVAGVQLDPVEQRNGQLMGSVLSFPILCLANLGLYLTVRKRVHEWAPLKNLLGSVLVNGDDMLYIGTREEWDLHSLLGKKIGLEMSPGKAYYHSAYANVNSTSVNMDLKSSSSDPVEVKFLNVGLMEGRHKVLGKVGSDDEVQEHPITSVIDEVVRGSLPGRQADIFFQYVAMHRDAIKKESAGRNLFIPKVLGGMGVSLIPDVETWVSDEQVFEAERLSSLNGLHKIVRPLPQGFLIESPALVYYDPILLAKEKSEERDSFGRKLKQHKREKYLWPYWATFKPITPSPEMTAEFWEGMEG